MVDVRERGETADAREREERIWTQERKRGENLDVRKRERRDG